MSDKAFDADGDKAYQGADSGTAYRVAGADILPMRGTQERTTHAYMLQRNISRLKSDIIEKEGVAPATMGLNPEPAPVIPLFDPRK